MDELETNARVEGVTLTSIVFDALTERLEAPR
jgi:hypothetical protein